jgi:hypothetical protein
MTMSLEAALESLGSELTALREDVSRVHVTVTEDKPVRVAAVLVDHLDNLLTDLSGDLAEAGARVAAVIRVSQSDGPLDLARSALRDTHEPLNRIAERYFGELASHAQISRLLTMSRDRGRECQEWTLEVKTGIERCEPHVRALPRAAMECWSELANRLARNTVSVRATNIGQQIALGETLEFAGKSN